MARINVLAWAAVGTVATLAFLPTTRWVLEEDWDFVTGGWSASFDNQGTLLPARIFDARLWHTDSERLQLAQATYLSFNITYPEPREVPYCKALTEFCATHPDNLEGWAHLLRHESTMAHMPLSKPEPAEIRDRLAWMERAAREGARLDPDNSYFPAMEAALKIRAGRLEDAKRRLLRASTASHFDDFTEKEVEMGILAVEDRWGYRGETTRTLLEMGTLFPHLSWLMRDLPLTVGPVGHRDPEMRDALVRFWSRFTRDSRSPLTLHLGYRQTAASILPGPNSQVDAEVLKAAREIDSREPESHIAELWESLPADTRYFDDDPNAEITNLYEYTPIPPYLPCFAFLMAIGSVPVLGLTAAVSGFKTRWAGAKSRRLWRSYGATACGVLALVTLAIGILCLRPADHNLYSLGLLVLAWPLPILLAPASHLNVRPWVAGIVAASALIVLASIPDRFHRDAGLGQMRQVYLQSVGHR